MRQTPESEDEYPTFPPEKLLDGDYRQIEAGLNCIDDPEVLRDYLAYENLHQNRTPVQELIRTRILRLRAREKQ